MFEQKVAICINLPLKIYKELKLYCVNNNISMTYLIIDLIKKHIIKDKKKHE